MVGARGARAGGDVALVIVLAQSKHNVAVPSVTGQSEQAATGTLKHAGLTAAPALAASTTVPLRQVISQSPAAGSTVAKGSQVKIVVSGGPGSSPLLDVSGLSAAEASSRLRKAGFRPSTKRESSTSVASGRVIGTEPSAHTDVQEGSPVTVLVSSGPPPVRVPDVVGQTLSAAEATLSNAELGLGSVTQSVSSTQTPGTVLAQYPSSGTLHAGDKVDLTVAQAPKEVDGAQRGRPSRDEGRRGARSRRFQAQVRIEPHERTLAGGHGARAESRGRREGAQGRDRDDLRGG